LRLDFSIFVSLTSQQFLLILQSIFVNFHKKRISVNEISAYFKASSRYFAASRERQDIQKEMKKVLFS